MAEKTKAKIKVIGVGGAGTNVVNHMVRSGVEDVVFIAVNTDGQVLDERFCLADIRIQIGQKTTAGLGAGADPELGRKAAEESRDEIKKHLDETDMVFIAAGMGGGSGTGAAPVIAQLAKEMGILTVGVITTPFKFEGPIRIENARIGKENMYQNVDTLITIPNDRLREHLKGMGVRFKMREAFANADDVLRYAVHGITEVIQNAGYINVDFADVKKILSIHGDALMGIGIGEGEAEDGRAIKAAEMAINNPLLERGFKGANGVVCNIAGGEDMEFEEWAQAADFIREEASDNPNIIIGWSTNEGEEYVGKIRVMVIATGFEKEKNEENSFEEEGFNVLRKSESVVRHDNLASALSQEAVGDDASRYRSGYNRSSQSNPGLQVPSFMRKKENIEITGNTGRAENARGY